MANEYITDVVNPVELTGFVRELVDGDLPYRALFPPLRTDDIEYELTNVDVSTPVRSPGTARGTRPPIGKRPGPVDHPGRDPAARVGLPPQREGARPVRPHARRASPNDPTSASSTSSSTTPNAPPAPCRTGSRSPTATSSSTASSRSPSSATSKPATSSRPRSPCPATSSASRPPAQRGPTTPRGAGHRPEGVGGHLPRQQRRPEPRRVGRLERGHGRPRAQRVRSRRSPAARPASRPASSPTTSSARSPVRPASTRRSS
jgi:hypothetical protein